jgi:hypothetical protein
MSDKAEELAKQLLEKTESGKLQWSSVSASTGEIYRADLEGEFSFSIKRVTDGDSKILALELTGPEGVVLSAGADNLPSSMNATVAAVFGSAKALATGGALGAIAAAPGLVTSFPIVRRFRLFSDLFYAARRSAAGGENTIEKVQQLLERLG